MKLEKILQAIKNYFSFVLCLFAVYLAVYIMVTHFIFNNYNLPINYIGYISLVAIITAAVLLLILNINQLSAIIQGLLVYISVVISIYFIGFLTNCFTRTLTFWISSLIINLIGLCILFIVIIVKRTLENKRLNETLKNYKEREK